MNKHPTNRTLYVLAAISVLLFVISFFVGETRGALNLSNLSRH
jgi:hypothetical protein